MSSPKPLRLWPGIVLGSVLAAATYVVPRVVDVFDIRVSIFGFSPGDLGMLVGVVSTLLILVWWLFFSRARWPDRVGGILMMIAALFITKFVVDESIAGAGMGLLLYVMAAPGLALALVVAVVVSRNRQPIARCGTLAVALALACLPWILIRTAGVTGSAGSEFHWRWTPTPEERLLAQADDEPLPPSPTVAGAPQQPEPAHPTTHRADGKPASAPAPTAAIHPDAPKKEAAAATVVETGAQWPGFRGPNRDSIIRGVKIETDWSASPPAEIWRRPIGPGWSSFSVRGDVIYTQEQRGEEEIVAAYDLRTGQPVWRHRDAARFYESNGGAGPRATPALSGDRVYTHGATGIVNALDARDGSVIWTRNASTDTGAVMPGWGFTSSPLVIGDMVTVASSGRLVAYDGATGRPRWSGKSGGGSYSSPHLTTIDGVRQIVLLNGSGATSFAPADGKILWQYAWEGAPILQPAIVRDGDMLVTSGDMMGGMGARRIAVSRNGEGWKIEERWNTRNLKPYFNDLVVHEDHAYGFDGSILACVDLADGSRKWKGGRYGNGQMILLADQDLLLVLSEEGELALVSATPDKFTEIARIPAIEGKTWNHPVIVDDLLLVRNGEEMAAFRLRTVDATITSP